MADVVYVALTVVVFALLTLVARGVERLVRDDPAADGARGEDGARAGERPVGAASGGAAARAGRAREVGAR